LAFYPNFSIGVIAPTRTVTSSHAISVRLFCYEAGKGKHRDHGAPSPLELFGGVASLLKPALAAVAPTLTPALEVGRATLNNTLQALDAPVRLERSGSPTSDSSDHRGPQGIKPDNCSRPHVSTWTGSTLVANIDIQKYVDEILNMPGSVINSPWVPDVIERRVYILVVKMILQMMHFTFGAIDQRKVFGETLHMIQARSKVPDPLKCADVSLTPEMIDRLVDQVMVPSGDGAIISESVDRALYQNVIRFALRLGVDMASSLQASLFGLRIRLVIEADPVNAALPQSRAALDLEAFEQACDPLIDELLADEEINIAMLPDHTERRLYKHVLRLVANLGAAALDSSEFDIFGVYVDPDLV